MDRDEVQRRAAEGARRWREDLSPEERQAHYQRAAATRQRNKATSAAREADQRQADAVRLARRLERAQQSLAEGTRQARRIKWEQERQEAKAAAYVTKRTAVFWSYVDVVSPDECWQWLGSIYTGYGSFHWLGQPLGAHRVMWLVTHGSIPTGLVVDHLCERKACVSPYHLEPVSDAENKARRGVGRADSCRRVGTIPEFTSSAYRRRRRAEMLAEREQRQWCPPRIS